jgi:hypothetical protein
MRKFILLFITITHCALSFGQVESMSYEDANPGALHVYINTASDSAYLRSFIGDFDKSDIVRIKEFLNSSFVAENRNSPNTLGQHNWLLLDSLDKVLGDRRYICYLTTGDTTEIKYGTVLENEVTRPLILLVDQNHGFPCQMAVSWYATALEERIRKAEEELKKQTMPNTSHEK